jgi:hypothetical protein
MLSDHMSGRATCHPYVPNGSPGPAPRRAVLPIPPPPEIFVPPARLDELSLAHDYIERIDFSYLERVMANTPPLGLGWSSDKLAYVERQYRNWLFLRRKYEGKPLPPSQTIDLFWHAHILDSRAYWRDVLNIFGYYLHHFPYFGVRGDSDRQNLDEAFEQTQQLYRLEFGEEIYDFETEVPE